MNPRRIGTWLAIALLAALLTACPTTDRPPPDDDPPPVEPLTVGIDIRGGNNDHNPFTTTVELTLTGTTLKIAGVIPYVDIPPDRLAIREGNVWAHYQERGPVIAEYELQREQDGDVDLAGTVELTEEQAMALRQGQYYLHVNTDFPALGAIVVSEEQRIEGGTIRMNVSGLPEGAEVELVVIPPYRWFNYRNSALVSAAEHVFTDLYYGEFGVEPPILRLDGVDHLGAVSPASVTVGQGLEPVVEVDFSGIPR